MAKVTPAQARAIANAIVGRRPANAPAPTKVLKNQGTGLSPREKQQVSIRQPVQKIATAAGQRSPGQVAQQAFEKAQAQKAAFAKSTTAKNVAAPKPRIPSGPTQEKTSLGATITKAGTGGRKVSPSVTAQDVKDLVQQRTARQIAGPVKTQQERESGVRLIPSRAEQDSAARAAQQRANAKRVLDAKAQAGAANRQLAESKQGSTVLRKVANPMQEASAQREADARVNQGLAKIKEAESLAQKGRLGGTHAGGHGISELEMAQGKTPSKLGGLGALGARIARATEGEVPLP